jgi:uncharacterized membrane protein YphA (DoxX/SURF4 family)
MKTAAWAVAAPAPGAIAKATVLIRFAVGVVFLSEGLQKFLYPDALGAGRFAKIGIPMPAVMGPVVGSLEAACGLLVLLGLFVRLAVVPLMVDMVVAIASTKVPILIGHGYWGFGGPSVPKTGGWSMLHESRTDLAMLCGAAFLLVAGAGAWSLDERFALRRRLSGEGGRGPARVVAEHATHTQPRAPS